MSYFVGAMTTLIVFFAATKFVMSTNTIKKNTGIIFYAIYKLRYTDTGA